MASIFGAFSAAEQGETGVVPIPLMEMNSGRQNSPDARQAGNPSGRIHGKSLKSKESIAEDR